MQSAPDASKRIPFHLLGILSPLRKAALLWIFWLLLFQMMRLVLIVCTGAHRGEADALLLARAALHGSRFDMAIAAWLVAPLALWWLWRPAPKRVEKRLVFAAFLVSSLLGIFALVAEVEFYKEFQMRLGPLAFEYFSTNEEHNAIVLGMVWHGYPVLRWTLFCLVVWAAFAFGSRRLFREAPGETVSLKTHGPATLILITCTVLAIRGGLGAAPLRWGDAFFSHNAYANQMAMNGLWAMIDTARHAAKDKGESSKWMKRMPVDEAVLTTREIVLLPGEKLVDADKFPLLRTSPPNEMLVRKPRNVVLVLMESFSARFNDAIGADFGATPNFAALARESILYDRAFSVSTHTAPGVFGTLCSFPILPDAGYVMKSPLGQQKFRSLPRIFSENGFETLFLYNGQFSWDNKEGFFRHEGIQRFIGRHDFKNPVFVDPDWGVSDQDVFDRAVSEFNDMSAHGKPFFSVILTLSNHAPFNLPQVDGLEPIRNGGAQNQRLNGVHYADWALGRFMDMAREQPWHDDTLFVFTGDHGFGIPPKLTELSLLHMHVPLMFHAPALFKRKGEVRHGVAGHLDILPTIIGLMGFDTPHQAFGRDLFRLPQDDKGHAFVKRSGEPLLGCIEDDSIFVGSVLAPPGFHRIDLGFPPSASDDLLSSERDAAKAFSRKLDAMVVTGLHTLESRLAAPK
jgi:phosphoglycerol transferase MdoB-like AlkP superfamily enzyme